MVPEVREAADMDPEAREDTDRGMDPEDIVRLSRLLMRMEIPWLRLRGRCLKMAKALQKKQQIHRQKKHNKKRKLRIIRSAVFAW